MELQQWHEILHGDDVVFTMERQFKNIQQIAIPIIILKKESLKYLINQNETKWILQCPSIIETLFNLLHFDKNLNPTPHQWADLLQNLNVNQKILLTQSRPFTSACADYLRNTLDNTLDENDCNDIWTNSNTPVNALQTLF